MPCTQKRIGASNPGKRRPLKQKDETRFNCPYPGCDRSCAELWRLKVHFRAPPDNKGSGVERGHNAELQNCPRCLQRLETGKHHIGCRSGLAAPRQAQKREERNQEARLRERARPESKHKNQRCAKQEPAPVFSGLTSHDGELVSQGVFASAQSFSSLGNAIQLQRHYDGLRNRPQPAFPVPPAKLSQSLGTHAATNGPVLLDCEVDDEVFIPRSFAPLLSHPSAHKPATPAVAALGPPPPLTFQPYTGIPAMIGSVAPELQGSAWCGQKLVPVAASPAEQTAMRPRQSSLLSAPAGYTALPEAGEEATRGV